MANPQTKFPMFVDRTDDFNLRQVAPRLWVGAERSPTKIPEGVWALVVDLYGEPFETKKESRYKLAKRLLHWPFIDGDNFPQGALFTIGREVKKARRVGPVLIHCQAGLSRSASAAYMVLRCCDGLSHDEAIRRVFVEEGWPRTTTIASAKGFVDAVKRVKAG